MTQFRKREPGDELGMLPQQDPNRGGLMGGMGAGSPLTRGIPGQTPAAAGNIPAGTAPSPAAGETGGAGRPGQMPQGFGSVQALLQKTEAQAIGKKELEKAREKLHRYMAAKASLDRRIADDEDWWRLRHWTDLRLRFKDHPEEKIMPRSAWLLNSIMNKHADAMDNFPTVTVLPRAADDQEDARRLTEVLPVILEENNFEEVYDHSWWTKLKTGTRVLGVFWDGTKENGVGDVSIQEVDVLNLFWEPGIRDIQQSDAVFCLQRVTIEKLKEQWGDKVKDFIGGEDIKPIEYRHDDPFDKGDETTVVDWYYKKRTPEGKTVLHLVKWVGDTILFASENTDCPGYEQYREKGWYEDGHYPFVFDALYPIADSICGFGEVDIMRDPQTYIDKMDDIILRNAMMNAHKRYFSQNGNGLNEDEFTDWENHIVHVEGSIDESALREIAVGGLDTSVYTMRQNKIDELKETSGNRDFSQGASSGGITAASAIAALQEAGSKLSRDMIKASYRAFVAMNNLVIERIRQFYDTTRTFRITGENGEEQFVQYDNRNLSGQSEDLGFGMEGKRRPIFDMKVKSEKNSPFSRISQNELAKELYGAGVFNPEMADQALMLLDMMDFEGCDQLKQKIAERGTVFDQMQQQIAMLQQQVALLSGGQVMPAQAQPPEGAGMYGQMPQNNGAGTQGKDPTRDAFQGYAHTLPDQAAQRARNVNTVRS
jgi:hypothetical protein